MVHSAYKEIEASLQIIYYINICKLKLTAIVLAHVFSTSTFKNINNIILLFHLLFLIYLFCLDDNLNIVARRCILWLLLFWLKHGFVLSLEVEVVDMLIASFGGLVNKWDQDTASENGDERHNTNSPWI